MRFLQKTLMITTISCSLSVAGFEINHEEGGKPLNAPILALPCELLIGIFSVFSAKELSDMAFVCKPIRNVSESNTLWRLLYHAQFGTYEGDASNIDDINWKERFRTRQIEYLAELKKVEDINRLAQWPAEKIKRTLAHEDFTSAEDLFFRVFKQKLKTHTLTLKINNPKSLMSLFCAYRAMRNATLKTILAAASKAASNLAIGDSKSKGGRVVMDAHTAMCSVSIAAAFIDQLKFRENEPTAHRFPETVIFAMAAANEALKQSDATKASRYFFIEPAQGFCEGVVLALKSLSPKNARQVGQASCRLAILSVWASTILSDKLHDAFANSFDAALHILEADTVFELSKKDALKIMGSSTWDRKDRLLNNKHDASLQEIIEIAASKLP